jgi:hypothetical protein
MEQVALEEIGAGAPPQKCWKTDVGKHPDKALRILPPKDAALFESRSVLSVDFSGTSAGGSPYDKKFPFGSSRV